MTIDLNGKNVSLEEDITLLQLLQMKSCEESKVAVAINQQIISHQDYAKTILHEGDKVLLIGAAKGGRTLLLKLIPFPSYT